MDEIDNEIRSSDINPSNKDDKKCGPSNSFNNGSCIPLNILVNMVEGYNQQNSANKIKLHPKLETLNPTKYKRYLIKELGTKLSDVCTTQRCWLKQSFISQMKDSLRKNLKKNTFRPKGPQGKFTWLNTYNINDVVEQYEKKYSDFKFMGAVPIDFDELPQLGIKNLDFDQMIKKGKKKLGFIFNLDEHYKGGSHWVSMFTDLNDGKLYFSDSYGVAPEKRIRTLMRRIANYFKNNNIRNSDIKHNTLQHQRGGSECGVYSIHFILQLLKGTSFEELSTSRLSDSEVNRCRDVYFIKEK